MTHPFPPQPDQDQDSEPAVDIPIVPTEPAREAPARTRFAEPVLPPAAAPAPAPVAPAVEPVPAVTEPPAPPPVVVPALEAPALEAPAVPWQPDAASFEDPYRSGSQTPTRGRALVAGLAFVVVLLAGLTGFLGWKAVDTAGAGPVETSREAALQASRNAATMVFSYDYRHLAKDFAAGRAQTTGEFQAEYDKTTAKLVSDVASRYKAVVVAAVSEASVVQAGENQVVALLFINQQSSSSLISAPKITTSRLEMTMVHQHGHWLVSKIKAL